MPELPEVETVVRGLQGAVAGRVITGVTARWRRAVRPSAAAVARGLPGRRVTALTRRGKYLVFHLDRGALLIHLKMSGNLQVVPAGERCGRHVRTVFALDNGCELRFEDPRKFGRVYLADDPAEVVGRLGPEPLPATFSADDFAPCSAAGGAASSRCC